LADWMPKYNFDCPRKFLHEKNDFDSLSTTVREIFLMESTPTCARAIDSTVAELVTCACNQITYGSSAESRRNAFELIHQLYFVPIGKQELQRLGQPGGILESIANSVFNG
jgi:hypothetical protein